MALAICPRLTVPGGWPPILLPDFGRRRAGGILCSPADGTRK
jgi:hypothetical protein